MAFNRGDPQPHNALGDTFVARAESASDATETLACYNAALGEGYSAALRLDARNSDALVGTAEVQAMLFVALSGLKTVSPWTCTVSTAVKTS